MTKRPGWNEPFKRPAKPLRQAVSTTVATDAAPSWWVNVDRSAWASAVQQHQADLSASIANKWVPLRLLQ